MVSVLMPAYNAAAYIAAAIDSVLAQTVRELDLLVIDDGSTDGTLDIVRGFVRRDARVRVLAQVNEGIAGTLNRGLEMLDDEWVFLMHADDLMMPRRIERQLAFIAENPDLAVASALVYYINDTGEGIGRGRSRFTAPGAIAEAVRRGDMIAFSHSVCALRRSAVLDVGGYRQAFWPAEDCDLWARMVERGYRVAVQNEYLLKYRIHGSSASISRARLMQQKALWVECCIAIRRRGEREPTWPEFQAARRRMPWPAWLKSSRQELGRTYFQAAVHSIATRDYVKFVPMLAAAAALEPRLVLSRVMPRLLNR